jgi:hypothetical protein
MGRMEERWRHDVGFASSSTHLCRGICWPNRAVHARSISCQIAHIHTANVHPKNRGIKSLHADRLETENYVQLPRIDTQ